MMSAFPTTPTNFPPSITGRVYNLRSLMIRATSDKSVSGLMLIAGWE